MQHEGHAVGLASFSADGKWLVSIDAGSTLRIGDVEPNTKRVNNPEAARKPELMRRAAKEWPCGGG